MPEMVIAGTLNTGGVTVDDVGVGGAQFKGVYEFVVNAATGYLGRAIAIVGGVIGLATGAMMGKALPAIMGVLLACFAVLGPTVVSAIFTSALI